METANNDLEVDRGNQLLPLLSAFKSSRVILLQGLHSSVLLNTNGTELCCFQLKSGTFCLNRDP
jgi:hypothetical protein